MKRTLAPMLIGLLAAGLLVGRLTFAGETGSAVLSIFGDDGAPLPCRVHLSDEAGKPVQPEGLPFFRDHFVCEGSVSLPLTPGKYEYEVERGPEFTRVRGSFEIQRDALVEVKASLRRFSHLAARGWYAGDLHIHRDLADIELLMRAEDLHVGPVITWWNGRNYWNDRPLPEQRVVRFDGNRYYEVLGGEDERQGGALLYFGLDKPLALPGDRRAFPEWPSPLKFVDEARRQDAAWIDIEKPFWWDAPVWLASGKADSIGLANNHMCRSRMLENEAWGRPRDTSRLPPPRGNGFWTQEIYYHALNCGLRIPPSAGSASGVLPNPVGYNRVYVHVGAELSYRRWWQRLKAGRCFVTNGPLLLCQADGHLPGHVFRAAEGAIEIPIDIELQSNDPSLTLEIIKDGVAGGKAIRPTERLDGPEPVRLRTTVRFDRSGWFLVRTIADNDATFRFASTAPYYVEIGESKQRVSRASTQFFVDWVDERIKQIESTVSDAKQREEVLAPHLEARDFWRKRLAEANAE
jgi:hypothetical protein